MLPSDKDYPAPARLLSEGIQAARQGDRGLAQSLLLQVVEQDERNEKAWLWLSGVVETDADRLVCLENVLAINPQSAAAKKGLARLRAAGLTTDLPAENTPAPEFAPAEEEGVVEYVFRKELPPISAASAVLYPERQVMELRWKEKTNLHTIPPIAFGSATAYDDIWEKEIEICAYCAQEVAYDDTQCPKCKRKLLASHFVYPKPSPDLMVFFIMVLATAQLYFIQTLLDLIKQTPLITVVWHIFLFGILFALSGAIFLRRFWAYTASIVILLLIFLSMILDITTGLAELDIMSNLVGISYLMALADNPVVNLLSPLLEFLPPFQMLAIFLALLYGIFKAGPDFERVRTRRIAAVDKALNDASAYYEAGKLCAKEKMWASAVLYFRRAAANEPNRAYFHVAAGKAYAQLGFYRRAKDAYESGRRVSTTDKLKKEIDLSLAQLPLLSE